jgi:heat-inducible transcriptional repressor
MRQPTLNERGYDVLKIIIQTYMDTADPVGSRTVSKKSLHSLSPATIRNIMADLEDFGLVEQPHTSAGRIPTDLGYRLYVDKLSKLPPLTRQEKEHIERAYREEAGAVDFFELSTRLLSSLCHHAGMILLPSLSNATIERIQFIRVKPKCVMVVFVTTAGLVHNRKVELGEDIVQERLDAMARYLNIEFSGFTLRGMRQKILERMNEEKAQYDSLLQKAMEVSQKALEEDRESGELVVGGTVSIFDYPELVSDVEKMRNIFKAFEEKGDLVKILDKCLNEAGTCVFIGSESQVREMEDFSFVAHAYKSGETNLGALGVFGPKRMEYPRVMAIVHHMAEVMSRELTTPK